MRKLLLSAILVITGLTANAKDYLEEGDRLSEFSFETIDGDSISIEDLKGQVVYINFFATWCSPCLKELGMMKEELLDDIDDDDFYFVALGRGHTAEQLIAFKDKKGFDLNFGMDTDKELFYRFSEKGIPLNIVIDRDGKIIMKKTGFSEASFKKTKRTIKRAL